MTGSALRSLPMLSTKPGTPLQALSTTQVHVVQRLGGVGPSATEAYAANLSRHLAQLL